MSTTGREPSLQSTLDGWASHSLSGDSRSLTHGGGSCCCLADSRASEFRLLVACARVRLTFSYSRPSLFVEGRWCSVPHSIAGTLRHPAAWLPIVVPLALVTYIAVYLSWFGVPHSSDEGTAAHIFQLTMLAEFALVVVFAVRWLPKAPAAAAIVLGIQLLAAATPLALVFVLGL